MSDKYILQGQTPVPCDDLLAWGRWMQTANRHVAKDDLGDGVRVSTVFLGLDHRFDDEGLPVLFETMIFGGPHDQYQDRYTTWEDAVAGHAKALALTQVSA